MTDDHSALLPDFIAHLKLALEQLRLVVPEEAVTSMASHYLLMLDANAEFNLTTILDPREAAVKHYADSLALLPVLDRLEAPGNAIDVGSGAGFPGMPLAMARPQWQWVLAESVQKKAKFLSMAVERLNLENVIVVAERSELLARQRTWRDRFLMGTARAVAPMGAVAELLSPFVKAGGIIIGMKGPKEPLPQPSEDALRKLACDAPEVVEYDLTYGMGERCLVILKKTQSTSDLLPRRPGMAAKRPLF